MSQNELFQETLFSFLGEEEATPVGTKEQKVTSKSKNETAGKKAAPAKVTPKPVEEKLELTVETIIRYGGESLPVTDYFSVEEITEGIRILEGEKVGELRPINSEDLRKRMEEDYAELIEGYTHMIFNKEKNLVLPLLQARKKGAKTNLEDRCYYCEKKKASTTKFEQPCCVSCSQRNISTVGHPEPLLNNQQMAKRLKIMMSTFRFAFEEQIDEDHDF